MFRHRNNIFLVIKSSSGGRLWYGLRKFELIGPALSKTLLSKIGEFDRNPGSSKSFDALRVLAEHGLFCEPIAFISNHNDLKM